MATARRLLTIIYRVLSQERLYQRTIKTRKIPQFIWDLRHAQNVKDKYESLEELSGNNRPDCVIKNKQEKYHPSTIK